MLHELEHILQVLHTIDDQTKENIFEKFEKNEIQSELKEIDDFPELLQTIHHHIELLKNHDVNNITNVNSV